MTDLHTRRTFLGAAMAAGAAWTAADLGHVEAALAWAHQTAAKGQADLGVLTAEQAQVLDAFTARIIPSVDGRPGAHEAGVVYFIDKSLATFNAPRKKVYADGVVDLNRRATEKSKSATSFAALSPPQQDEVVREIEKTPFFEATRFDTIVGMFALPTYGGNRDHVGWHMLGLEHQAGFRPPFGYYDADINKRG